MGHKNKPNKRKPNKPNTDTDRLAAVLGVADATEFNEKLGEEPEELNEELKGEEPNAEAEGGETVQPANDSEPTEVSNMEEVIRKLAESIPDEGLRAKAIAEITKLYTQESATKQSRGWVKFDEDFKPAIEKLIAELVVKHGLAPENQKITILFPDGKAAYSRGLKGKASNGGGSNRSGFPTQWGPAKAGDQEFGSPSKMAETLGCQVNGKGAGYSDMVDVFDSQGHAVMELPAGEKFNELLAKQTDPARKARLAGLTGKVFRVKV